MPECVLVEQGKRIDWWVPCMGGNIGHFEGVLFYSLHQHIIIKPGGTR